MNETAKTTGGNMEEYLRGYHAGRQAYRDGKHLPPAYTPIETDYDEGYEQGWVDAQLAAREVGA